MRKFSLVVALLSILLLAAVGLPALAQSEGSVKSLKQEEVSLVGCLDEGDEEGYYVLETEDEDVTVMGDEEIGKHIGHKVELTGHWQSMDDEMVFVATKIKHIAADCED